MLESLTSIVGGSVDYSTMKAEPKISFYPMLDPLLPCSRSRLRRQLGFSTCFALNPFLALIRAQMVGSCVRVSPDVVFYATLSAASLLNEISCFFPPRGVGSSMEASSV